MIDLCVKDIYNGFDEEARRNIQNFMQQQAAKEQEQQRQQQVQSQKQPNQTQQSLEQQKKKPELANWQKVMDNGEYLRSAEMAEEANYNMIDGLMNNMPKKKDKNAPRRSVLKRLRKHQQKIASQGKGQPQHIVLEIFRNFIRISFSGIFIIMCAYTMRLSISKQLFWCGNYCFYMLGTSCIDKNIFWRNHMDYSRFYADFSYYKRNYK